MNSSSMPSDLSPPAPRGSRRGRSTWTVVAGVLAGAILLGGLVIFTAGEDLLGSDNGSIDSYNREVLESCDVPDNWTLVRTYIFPDVNAEGDTVRTMSYVWASPQTADEVAAYYGIDGPGIWTWVSGARSCNFGQRPSALVLGLWQPDHGQPLDRATQTAGLPARFDDEFWAGPGSEVTDIDAVPASTHSFVRLRLGQRVSAGIFGLGPPTRALLRPRFGSKSARLSL
jgi:hypothetical protein